jgi:ABC-2 type transport system ATP-binding protein
VGLITVDQLRKTYGRVVAIDDLSFDVETGEIFGILGPNGAGKTTTVECVQGLRRPDGGRIRVLGLDPTTEASQLRQRIGLRLATLVRTSRSAQGIGSERGDAMTRLQTKQDVGIEEVQRRLSDAVSGHESEFHQSSAP